MLSVGALAFEACFWNPSKPKGLRVYTNGQPGWQMWRLMKCKIEIEQTLDDDGCTSGKQWIKN